MFGGYRWQSHHQDRVLSTSNLHTLNLFIKDTDVKQNQMDNLLMIFGMTGCQQKPLEVFD